MTTKTLASSLAALALFAAQGAPEPVWQDSLKGTTINAVGFENYTLGTTLTNTYDDAGLANSSQAYFLYSGASGDDNSVVTNYPIGYTHSERPAYFADYDEGQYLSLSTEGGTLFRSLNPLNTAGETPALGTAEPVPAATGLFVDTLVQFTPCEEPPSVDDGNKLAIWLSVTNISEDPLVAQTNLCVKAGYLTYEDSTYGRTSATYTLANTQAISIEAGEWVRLTVKAINNIYTAAGMSGQPAFQVYINDTLAEFTEAVGSADYLTQLATDDADAKANLETKTFLPSMQSGAALQAVGFQGTGAVDDFVVTTQKPGFLAVDFTLFWDSNILALDAYLNGGDDPVDFTGSNLSKVFEGMGDGDTIEIELPAPGTSTSVEEGYEIDWENTVLTNVTMAPLTFNGNVYAYEFTLDGDGPYSVSLVTKSSGPAPIKTVTPGVPTVLDATTQVEAETEAATVAINITDSAAAAAGQIDVVKKIVTYDESTHKYSVEVVIDTNAVGFVDADVTVADVATNLTTIAASSESTVSITLPAASVTPGLYYSVAMVTDLATATSATWAAGEGTRVLATSGTDLTLSVPKPTSGTKAFYKVFVNMVGNTPAPVPNAGE